MPRANVGFSNALEDCLNAIGHGQTIEECLAHHPKHAERLRPYLQAVIQMRQSSQSERKIPVDLPAGIPFNVALNHSIQMLMRGKSPEYCYAQYPEHAAQLKPWLDAVVDVRENGNTGTVKELDFPSDLLAPQVTFTEALEYCLDALARGIQPEVALSRYPYYADRLRIWVYYIATLRMRIDMGLRPEPPRLETPVRPHISTRRKYSRPFYHVALSILLVFFLLVFFALVGLPGFAQAATDALPGDPLYPIKQTIRQVQIGLAAASRQPEFIANIEHQQRVDVFTLIENNKERPVEFTAQVLAVEEDGVIVEDVGKVFINSTEKLSALQAGVRVFVQGSTSQKGVSAKKVDLVDAPGEVLIPPTATQRMMVPTATRTALPTSTATRWFSPTPTVRLFTPTWTNSPTSQPTETFTSLPTHTLTNTPTFTATSTNTPFPTFTLTFTNTPAPTFTPSLTATDTATPVPSNTPTSPPTNTAPPTSLPTDTSTPRPTNTPTLLPTSTFTPPPTSSPISTPDSEFSP
jgi:hypothetical protein